MVKLKDLYYNDVISSLEKKLGAVIGNNDQEHLYFAGVLVSTGSFNDTHDLYNSLRLITSF
jgi:hypothetical protein